MELIDIGNIYYFINYIYSIIKIQFNFIVTQIN